MAVNPIPTIHMVKRIERNGNISGAFHKLKNAPK